MNVKIISQIVAGIFALATTWLTVAYAKQSSVDREKTVSISKLEQRVKALEGVRHSPSQHYLKIIRVEKRGFSNMNPSVRIVANVNGQPYSYPSEAVWSDIQSETPGESFPLPSDQSEYALRFSAFYRADDGKILQLTSSNSARIAVPALPFLDTFDLYLLDSGVRGGSSEGLTIHYEIR